MKATGIVRRIDDLGRVVIPKEIRRTLRIREGDPLEIYTDRGGEVILKKYSPIGELGVFAREYAESLSQTMECIACISDKDNIVAVAGGAKKDLKQKAISRELESLMESRQAKISNRKNDENIVPIIENMDDVGQFTGQVIVPIIAEGDPIGSVMMLSREQEKMMGDTELKIAQTAAGFLGKQMEQ